MKRFSLVQVALLTVLMVVAVSCTTYRDASGDYYEDESRYMYQRTPYVGGASVIIVERDPLTGRYYQVSPYGYYSGSPYYYNDSRSNRYYNNRGYTNRTYQQPVTEQQRQQTRENMEAAKERVLGQKKNN